MNRMQKPYVCVSFYTHDEGSALQWTDMNF